VPLPIVVLFLAGYVYSPQERLAAPNSLRMHGLRQKFPLGVWLTFGYHSVKGSVCQL